MLCISLNSFVGWCAAPAARCALGDLLKQLPEQVTGVELHVHTTDALIEWAGSLEAGAQQLPEPFGWVPAGAAQRLLAMPHTSVHLPSLSGIAAGPQANALCDTLQYIAQRLPDSHFTLHPDGVSVELWPLLGSLAAGLGISVENMDKRKQKFQRLDEMAELLDTYPSLWMTFDVCHWLEFGRSLDAPEVADFLESYRARISRLHLAVPASRLALYDNFAHIPHKLIVRSGETLSFPALYALGGEVPWVIEGYVPLEAGPLLFEEVKFLHLGRAGGRL